MFPQVPTLQPNMILKVMELFDEIDVTSKKKLQWKDVSQYLVHSGLRGFQKKLDLFPNVCPYSASSFLSFSLKYHANTQVYSLSPAGAAEGVVYDPFEKHYLTSHRSGEVHIWNGRNLSHVSSFRAHQFSITRMSFIYIFLSFVLYSFSQHSSLHQRL